MKRTASNHIKVRALMRALHIPRYAAIGLLELLWHVTAEHAPTGAIGRWSDQEIADALEWEGAAADLIEALVLARWVDRIDDADVRLAIHDWSHHCDDGVHTRVAHDRAYFVGGGEPRCGKLAPGERDAAVAYYEARRAAPEVATTRDESPVVEASREGSIVVDRHRSTSREIDRGLSLSLSHGHSHGGGEGPRPRQRPRKAAAAATPPAPAETPAPAATPSSPPSSAPSDGRRSPEHPPDGVPADDWRRACDVASSIESAEHTSVVVGAGQTPRALAVLGIAELLRGGGCVDAVAEVARLVDEWLAMMVGHKRLWQLLGECRRWEDGIAPRSGGRGPSRLDQVARLLASPELAERVTEWRVARSGAAPADAEGDEWPQREAVVVWQAIMEETQAQADFAIWGVRPTAYVQAPDHHLIVVEVCEVAHRVALVARTDEIVAAAARRGYEPLVLEVHIAEHAQLPEGPSPGRNGRSAGARREVAARA